MNESRKYLIVLKNLSGFNYKAAIVNMYKSRPMYYRLVPRAERSGANSANGHRRHAGAIVNMYKSRPMYYRLVLRVERLLTAEALRRKFISLIITLNKLLEV